MPTDAAPDPCRRSGAPVRAPSSSPAAGSLSRPAPPPGIPRQGKGSGAVRDGKGKGARGRGHLPVRVRLVDDQQQLELSAGGRRGGGGVHQPGRGRRLLHGVGQGAEEAAARRLLRLRRLLLGGRRLRWLPTLRGRGARGGRRGGRGRRRRRLLRVRPLQVRHVAIGQVSDEAAVREPAPQKVHHLAGREKGEALEGGWTRARSRAGGRQAPQRALRSAAGLGRRLTAGRGGEALPSPQPLRLARLRRSRPPASRGQQRACGGGAELRGGRGAQRRRRDAAERSGCPAAPSAALDPP